MNSRILVPVSRERDFSEGTQVFSLRNEFDQVSERYARNLGDFTAFRSGEVIPRMTVNETDRETVFTARHAHLEADDVEVVLADDLIAIRGEKAGQEGCYADETGEAGFGAFSRCFEVPLGTEPSDVDASIEDGVLTVKFPKLEAEKGSAEDEAA